MDSTTTATNSCAKCGREVRSLRCGHCGSRLPHQQAQELAAVHRKMARLGGERFVATQDEYFTPDNAVAMLLPYLPKTAVIWECAWGQGHIARYLKSQRYTVVGGPDVDFLTDSVEFDLAVTNPPFSKKDDFLRRAYSLGKPFAMLLPADSLVGVDRYPLFAQHGIQLLIPNRRIQFICERDTACNFNAVWFCWRLLPQAIVFAEIA